MDRLLAADDAAAHPLASATIEDIDVRLHGDDAEAFVSLRIDEGPRFIISEMTVEGNSTTSADVILRETRIGKDEPFDPVKVADIRPRLERLNLFSSVSDPALYVRNDKGGLLLRIAEGNTNVFDGVVGYQPPRAGEDAGYVTGLVNVSFRNLFGSGRRFDARWERASRSTTELELRASSPGYSGYR
ncbi:MAG: hypothetical protein IPP94_13890 [Ignavibacteria bacterium]|nr:hypothetical protein [Ignavibacteria bacterium]